MTAVVDFPAKNGGPRVGDNEYRRLTRKLLELKRRGSFTDDDFVGFSPDAKTMLRAALSVASIRGVPNAREEV